MGPWYAAGHSGMVRCSPQVLLATSFGFLDMRIDDNCTQRHDATRCPVMALGGACNPFICAALADSYAFLGRAQVSVKT